MQTVSASWSAEAKDNVRKIAHNFQVSWHKESTLGNRTFTIGVSTIGGNDVIGINPGAIAGPGAYKYFNETDYVTELEWERGLSMPTGGLSKAMAGATLDNTSGRFTPRYMGGSSELFTAMLPRRPAIINAGFEFDGIPQTIPQFAGVFDTAPKISTRHKEVKLKMSDYVDFFGNKFLDRVAVFTAVSTDTVLESLFVQMGMSTAQYRLDPGINVIPFALIDKGTKFSSIINDLVEAENGQLYQDEDGIFRFENRQHWDSAPYTNVQRVITTSQVIEAEDPDDDHLINVVEIKSMERAKSINQKLWSLSSAVLVPANGTVDIFADFSDDDGALPVLQVDTPAYAAGGGAITSAYATNTIDDNTGSTNSAAISLKSYSQFATAYKMRFQNTSSQNTYITALDLWGRPAKVQTQIYTKKQRDSSVTAYEERPLMIDNQFIQNQDWADSFAEVLLEDYAQVENLQKITIRAIPELQLGDLISWQGRYWRIYDIKTSLDPASGFIQELTMLQRTIRQYFRIGISTIGGTDKIAP